MALKFKRLSEQISGVFRQPKTLLFVAIAAYTIFFSAITILRHYGFMTYAYDLGIYNQALHNPLYNGQLLYNTADLLANPSGNLFGIHFSPLLLGIYPIYILYPNPTALLVIQTFLLALGAYPLYMIASKRLHSEKWGLIFAVLYLLNPALHSVNWYDFHPEAFLPALILFSLYFFDAKKTGLFIASVLLTLASIEFSAFLLGFMALYFIIKQKPWNRSDIDPLKLKLAVLTIVVSVVWLFVSIEIIHSINPLVRPLSGDAFWGQIGAKSLLDVPIQALTHPDRVIQALSFDGALKASYFLALLGSVAFLPLLEPLIVVCLMPWLITCLISNYQPFYQFGDQYPSYIIPFLFYGAVLGLAKLKSKKVFTKKRLRAVLAVLLCISAIIIVLHTPLNRQPLQSVSWFSYGFPDVSQHDKDLSKLLGYIPPDASVLTQYDIFPHLSNRPNAYVFPAVVYYPPGETFGNVLNRVLSRVDFIVGDLRSDDKVLPILLQYISVSGGWGVYAADDGALIMKRGYTEAPVYFKPLTHSYTASSLVLVDGANVQDKESQNGVTFMHSTTNKTGDLFWVGPYVFLLPGDYQAAFSVKTVNASDADLLDLYVSYFPYKATITHLGTNTSGGNLQFQLSTDGDQSVLTSQKVNGADLKEINRYQNFTLNFNVSDFGAYEFRGTSLSNSTNVYFDGVSVAQVKPSGDLHLEIQEIFPK